MDHVAIMDSRLGLIPKIISGEKDVESRWYARKRAPWGKIEQGDFVYFKNAGGFVVARAEVSCVKQYDNLDRERIREMLREYAKRLGVDSTFFQQVQNKRYCILVELLNPERVEPFKINKKGFAIGDAWLVLPDIQAIRR